MKIVCDACSAKYSIADDKVKGKVFKIRCKKCSNIIVVRGNAGGAEEPAAPVYDQKETRVYDYQGYDESAAGASAVEDAVWHLVIDQEQVGPLAAAEIQRRYAAGEIDGDTYIWREGFADWQPLNAVDAFAGLLGGAAAALPSAPRGEDAGMFGGAGAPDEGGTARSDPGDLFAAAGAGAEEAGDDAGADLFGGAARGGKAAAAAASSEAAMFGGGGGGAAAAGAGADRSAKQAASADKRLRGERNENSVLFSLNNLAALASDQPRAPAPSQSSAASSASASSSGMPQQGGGEGSGLIDIRSMASTYLSDKGAAKAKPAVGSIDDLPVFSTSAFSEPAVMMPSPSSSSNNNKLLYALIGVVGLLAVVAVVLVVVVFAGDKDKGATPEQIAAATAPSTAGTPPAGGEAPAATPPAGGTPSGAAVPAVEPPKEEPKAEAPKEEPKAEEPRSDRKSDSKSDRSDRKSDRTDRKSDSKTDSKPDKPSKPEPSSGGGSCLDEVGCLLADKPPACCSKYGGGGGKKPTAPKGDSGGGDSGLPEELDRAMISTGVGKVRGRIEACGSKSSAKGEVKVSVKVAPNGSVSTVSVKSAPDATLGSCVASAMERASFSKTQNGGSFSYPFIFR
jgi:predicted Zn finger-like uncharacterized protein